MPAGPRILVAALFMMTLPAMAQQPRLEERLTPAEFQSAGLNKLTAAELARLNALLAGSGTAASTLPAAPDLDAQLEQAREEGRQQAREADRGLPPRAMPREVIESTLPGPFHGFARGREYTLANGQVWKQTDDARIVGARGQDVAVRVRPGFMNVWWLQIDGYNTQAKVQRVR